MNRDTKRNITAFLLSIALILTTIIVLTTIVVIGISLGQYLPYVVTGLVFLGFAYLMSIPIRDILEQWEQGKQNRMSYEEWNRKNNKENVND